MYVCQFSCGAASAVATKLILAEFPSDQVLIVNAFIRQEHEDNRRFLADCEKWFKHPIKVLQNSKYNASTYEVWEKAKYIKGPQGAPCSQRLKRQLLAEVVTQEDTIVFGFTSEEEDRLIDLQERFPEEKFKAPLIERGITKEDCLAIIAGAGIELPLMYRLGYQNANCIGCPKGGQNYWQKIRKDFPEQFVQISNIQEGIGPGAYFLRFRSGPRKNERMPLRELPEGEGNLGDEAEFSCGYVCEIISEELKGQ